MEWDEEEEEEEEYEDVGGLTTSSNSNDNSKQNNRRENMFQHLLEKMKEYISDVIKDRETSSDLQSTREQINRCFDVVDCFQLPHPGLEVTKKTYTGSINQISTFFKGMINRLELYYNYDECGRYLLSISPCFVLLCFVLF